MHTSLTLLHHVLAASSTTPKSKGSGFYSIFFLVAIFAVVYFIFLRPARNRQRAAVSTRRQVQVGDEITTTAGLIANVVAVTDDVLTLEVAPGVYSKYVPAAVLRVNGPDPEPEDTETERDVSTHEVIDDHGVEGSSVERSGVDDHAAEGSGLDERTADEHRDIDGPGTGPPGVRPIADPNGDPTDRPDEAAPA